MADLTLYHVRNSRSARVLWALEEIGAPYELLVIKTEQSAAGQMVFERNPAHLAANPLGKVPTLRHGEAVITESAAILLYLGDAFPAAGLAPAVDTPERAAYLRWLIFNAVNFEPATIQRMAGEGEAADKTRELLTMISLPFDTLIETFERELSGRDYLAGDSFSMADLLCTSNLGWLAAMKLYQPEGALAAYLARCTERPAAQRALAMDA